MKSFLIPCHSQTRRWLIASAAALQIVVAAGCASPGPPHPPSLNLPEAVKDLTVERVGDQVTLHWTTPEKTTDHVAIKGPMTAEICRILVAPVPPPQVCTAVKKLPVQSGATQASDTLPQSLTSDPPALLAYRVQIFNASDRSAGLSVKAFAVAGAPPPPVEQLQATPSRDGVLLKWQQKDTTAVVQLKRLLLAPDGTVAQPPPSKKAASPSASKSASKPTTKIRKPSASPKPQELPISSPAASTEVRLETPKETTDAGGTVDQTARKGESYRYTAQRVHTVSLQGHTLELRSAVSAPATVSVRDIFPPATPTGLEAVPGGATASDRSIDLSWTPGTDADLAGYSVYRQEVTSTGQVAGSATRLNPTPVVGPAYRDQTAVPGHRYAYRVTAVDAAGNESAPSVDVQETLREQ
jgi:hypothetical protein